ncbi:MAG: tetratricopeptide repeat protein [Myxococcota bacterium]|nr:tetratricopeptide repeat protein [Myxococcota bacterium]
MSTNNSPEKALTVAEERIKELAEEWGLGKVKLKDIVGLSPDELYAISAQGYHFFLQGKSERAQVIFEGLAALDPTNAYYHRALGAVYWKQKDPTKALKQFGYAIRIAPKDASSYVNRAEVFVATKQFAEAKADLTKVLALVTPSQEAIQQKAKAILQMITA